MKINLLPFSILCLLLVVPIVGAQTKRATTKTKVVKPAPAAAVSKLPPPDEGKGELIDKQQSLAGQNEMQVEVEIPWLQDISEADLKSDLEARLKENGITVIPSDPNSRKPILKIYVGAFSGSSYSVVYSMDIQFIQFFPVKTAGRPTKYVKGATWEREYFGVIGALITPQLRGIADKQLGSGFIAKWREVNPR